MPLSGCVRLLEGGLSPARFVPEPCQFRMSGYCAELSAEFDVVGLLLSPAFVGIVLKSTGVHLSPKKG